MEAGHPGQVHPVPGHLEDDASAETVPDGADPSAICEFLLLQHLPGCLEPLSPEIHVLPDLPGELPGVVGMVGLLPLPVHVHRQGDVP